jgi:hypothetical protein
LLGGFSFWVIDFSGHRVKSPDVRLFQYLQAWRKVRAVIKSDSITRRSLTHVFTQIFIG